MTEEDKKHSFVIEKDFADVPGLSGHTGIIEFPKRITGRMFAKYWEALKPVGERGDIQNAQMFRLWRAALVICKEYGRIEIDGIAPGDITPDAESVPIDIVSLVGELVDVYMEHLINVKKSVRGRLGTPAVPASD